MVKYHGKKSRLSTGRGSKSSLSKGNLISDFVMAIPDFIINIFYKIMDHKIILSGIIAGLIIAFFIVLVMDFNKVKALATFKPNVITKIYDKNGLLISELFLQKREVVTLDKIPKNLVNAFVAIEDSEFYSHYGINIKGIIRAFFINIASGRIKQGGSTITQQTAKRLLTSGRRSIYRKIKEAFISIMMEYYYSKDKIMSLYLNQIYFGHGASGVEIAAKFYFKKHVWELNLAECALIAGLPRSPNNLSPIKHKSAAMNRHRNVLARMVEMGFITVNEGEKAYAEFWPDYLYETQDISPSMNVNSLKVDRAKWFTEHIRRKLVKKYGREMVYEKGLLVYTTLDVRKQEAGERILKAALDKQTVVSGNLAFKNDDYIVDNFLEPILLVSDLFDIGRFRRKGSRENEKINNHIRGKIIEEFEAINFIAGIDPVGSFIDDYKKTYTMDKGLQRVEGCILSINQKNGYVETMIGGSEFSTINQLNRTIQSRRQVGSSIKPLLYTAAIESGKFTTATAILDSPVVYLDNEGGDWLPENYEGSYYGLVRLRKALAMSINVVSIRIADAIGIENVINYYKKLLKFGNKEAKKRIPRNFSIA